MTLFFGQLFVTVTNNGNRISILGFTRGYNITNGPNGIANLDPFHLFGHRLESLTSYFYVALLFFLVVLGDRLPRHATRAPGGRGTRCARTRWRPR